MALYGAYRLALERGDHAASDAMGAVFESLAAGSAVRQLLDVTTARGQHDLLPFARDRIDVLVACAVGSADHTEELQLFSDEALLDVGYLQIWGGRGTYVDRAPAPRTKAKATEEILSTVKTAALLKALAQLDESCTRVIVPEDPALLLETRSGVLAIGDDNGSAVGLEISLVRIDATNPTTLSRRRLGAAKAVRSSSHVCGVSVRPEVAMEVHAAALDGQWLEMESSGMRLLTRLPDFSQPASGVDCWLQPTRLFEQTLGVSVNKSITVPRGLALGLLRRHRWCLPLDTGSCLELVQSN